MIPRRNAGLKQKAIDQLYHDAKGIYGAPKIQFLLKQDYHLTVGIKRV